MGYVYLLCDSTRDNTYKIGVTRGKIENRIKKLQTGNSGEIFITDYFDTKYPFLIEKMLHRKYSSSNLAGEWYDLSSDEVLNFKETCDELNKNIESIKDNPFMKDFLK